MKIRSLHSPTTKVRTKLPQYSKPSATPSVCASSIYWPAAVNPSASVTSKNALPLPNPRSRTTSVCFARPGSSAPTEKGPGYTTPPENRGSRRCAHFWSSWKPARPVHCIALSPDRQRIRPCAPLTALASNSLAPNGGPGPDCSSPPELPFHQELPSIYII